MDAHVHTPQASTLTNEVFLEAMAKIQAKRYGGIEKEGWLKRGGGGVSKLKFSIPPFCVAIAW